MTATEYQICKRATSIDLALIISTLLISKSALLTVDAFWAYAGPISLLLTLGVATWRLGTNGDTWANQGVTPPKNISTLALQTFIALVVTIAVGIIAQSVATSLIGAPSEATQALDSRYQGRFENLPGNLPVYLFWLAMSWVVGGFTEEMLFRGVLFTRFEKLFSDVPIGAFLAVLFPAILFGQQHYYYQGLSGLIATGTIAVTSTLLYLAFKRNLWPLILSHGLSNSIGLTAMYLGLMQ